MATGRANTYAAPRSRALKSNEHHGRRGNGGKPVTYEMGQTRPYPTTNLPGMFKVTMPRKMFRYVAGLR